MPLGALDLRLGLVLTFLPPFMGVRWLPAMRPHSAEDVGGWILNSSSTRLVGMAFKLPNPAFAFPCNPASGTTLPADHFLSPFPTNWDAFIASPNSDHFEDSPR